MTTIIIPVSIPHLLEASSAVIDEIRGSRIAFRLLDEGGAEIQVGGAIIGEIADPVLPITQECLQQAIYEALPQTEEES